MFYTGVGFGLVYVPAIVSVGYYFEKKRSLAIGIAVCGAGVGTFVLSPFNRILEESYGIRGAFLVKSAIVLNMFVCGLLIRPVPVEPSEIKKALEANKRKLAAKRQSQSQSQSQSQTLALTIKPPPPPQPQPLPQTVDNISEAKSNTIAITITG